VAISLILSAQDNGNNDNPQNVGYELHLHMAHCLRRTTSIVTMKLQSAPPSSHLKYKYSFMEMKNI
jgi:hypothetical protein